MRTTVARLHNRRETENENQRGLANWSTEHFACVFNFAYSTHAADRTKTPFKLNKIQMCKNMHRESGAFLSRDFTKAGTQVVAHSRSILSKVFIYKIRPVAHDFNSICKLDLRTRGFWFRIVDLKLIRITFNLVKSISCPKFLTNKMLGKFWSFYF